MNFVDGCKSIEQVKAVAAGLKQGKGNPIFRDAWLLGFELMLRVSDLRELRYDDVQGIMYRLPNTRRGKLSVFV